MNKLSLLYMRLAAPMLIRRQQSPALCSAYRAAFSNYNVNGNNNAGGGYTKSYSGGSYNKGGYQKGSYNKEGGTSSYQSGGSSGDYQKPAAGGDRLMYNNKRIYLRGYNITKDKVMLAIQPKPAQFSENQGSYQVSKNGYIQVDMTPIEEGSNQVIPNSRRTFILLMKSVGDILDLDTRLAYDASVDEDGTYIQYHNQ
jgi:hypothetical protein